MELLDGMATPKIDGLSCSFLLAHPLAWITSKWLRTIPVEQEINDPKPMFRTVIRHGALKRSPSTIPLTYQSAIALKLAHQWHQPITRVAYQLCAEFTDLITLPQVLQSFHSWMLEHGTTASVARIIVSLLQYATINPLVNGHLQIHLAPPALTIWLQWLLASTFLDETRCNQAAIASSADYPLFNLPFVLLYVHARCCTILSLAHHCGYINLQAEGQACSYPFFHQLLEADEVAGSLGQSNTLSTLLWTIKVPTPIPWEVMFESSMLQTALDPHHTRAMGQPLQTLLCSYLNQIIETIESLERISLPDVLPGSTKIPNEKHDRPDTQLPQKARQQLINLSQQFQRFEKQWSAQFWNAKASDLQPFPSPILLTYLGIVCITQRVLHFPFVMAGGRVALPYEL